MTDEERRIYVADLMLEHCKEFQEAMLEDTYSAILEMPQDVFDITFKKEFSALQMAGTCLRVYAHRYKIFEEQHANKSGAH